MNHCHFEKGHMQIKVVSRKKASTTLPPSSTFQGVKKNGFQNIQVSVKIIFFRVVVS
jgi:hypothetical protein